MLPPPSSAPPRAAGPRAPPPKLPLGTPATRGAVGAARGREDRAAEAARDFAALLRLARLEKMETLAILQRRLPAVVARRVVCFQ